MKKYRFLTALLAITVLCFPSFAYSQTTEESNAKTEKAKALEKLRFKFDNRKWDQVDSTSRDNFSRVTYFPRETENGADSGDEMFRYQRTIGLLLEPKNYYDQLIVRYKKQSPNFYSRVIVQGENYILFEWGIDTKGDAPEYTELQKYMRGKTASHIIRYSLVNTPLSNDAKNDWIKRLQAASIETASSK